MRALLPLSLLAAGACATASLPRAFDSPLIAADVNGAPIVGDRPLTLRLGPGGQASGQSGCNSFTTTYRAGSRQRIEFGPIASTRMACASEIMDQETRYLSILDSAESYTVYGGGGISIIAPDGRAIRFRR